MISCHTEKQSGIYDLSRFHFHSNRNETEVLMFCTKSLSDVNISNMLINVLISCYDRE